MCECVIKRQYTPASKVLNFRREKFLWIDFQQKFHKDNLQIIKSGNYVMQLVEILHSTALQWPSVDQYNDRQVSFGVVSPCSSIFSLHPTTVVSVIKTDGPGTSFTNGLADQIRKRTL